MTEFRYPPVLDTDADDAPSEWEVVATGSSTARALRDWVMDGSAPSQAHTLLSKLSRNVEDAVILVLGDSTGNDSGEWVYLMAQQLGVRFATHTVKYTLWNGSAYPALSTVTTGSGARTLTIYNGSVAGARTFYPTGGLWATMVGAVSPDLIFVNYGHNQGTNANVWRSDYLTLTEALSEEHPAAGMILVLQNPSTADSYQAQRNAEYERIALQQGYGTINVWQAFVDYGATWTTDLMTDTVHPNAAGSALWVSEVMRSLLFLRGTSPRPRAPSAVTVSGRQLIQNGDWTKWSSTVPDGWVSQGSPTIARNSTEYESQTGYSLKITAAGGVEGRIYQAIPQALAAGRWVTVLARVYVPVGTSAGAGAVSLFGDGTYVSSTDSGSGGFTAGAWRWVTVSRKFSSSVVNPRVYLWGDIGTNNGNASFDHVSVVSGTLPLSLPGIETGGVRPGRLNSLGLVSSATLFSATGAPDGNYGTTGDYFFRTDSPMVYAKWGSTTWKALLTTISSDRGDTSQTLLAASDARIQRWATTLTANRTVTLSTGAAVAGDWFRVVRTGLGAFTLDVGGLKTIPSATAAFVDVAYDGSAWVLTGYGTL